MLPEQSHPKGHCRDILGYLVMMTDAQSGSNWRVYNKNQGSTFIGAVSAFRWFYLLKDSTLSDKTISVTWF